MTSLRAYVERMQHALLKADQKLHTYHHKINELKKAEK